MQPIWGGSQNGRPRRSWSRGLARLLAVAGMLAAGGGRAEGIEPVDHAYLQEHYTKYEHLIPMRDGVKLFTAVYAPKDRATTYPLWLLRTPYGIRPYGADAIGDGFGPLKYYAREKFIFALQDVRGRNGSEGAFVHARPIKPQKAGPADTDESTDVYDTIEWLLAHVPNHNGAVGLSGISYPGFYAACGAIDGHPALKAVSPQAPVCDWFVGDDFHHNGALYLPHAFGFLAHFEQKLEKPTREEAKRFDYGTPDGYAFYRELGPLAEADARYFHGRIAFWNDLMAHPNYDEFWQSRNLRPHLKSIRAAVTTVGGWFDAEDLFGALNVYRAIETQNPGVTNVLVMGPWSHGQWHADDGQRLGAVAFKAKTAEYFRQRIELPFFKRWLKGEAVPAPAEAAVFETGTCEWRQFSAWPPTNAVARELFLLPEGGLGFDRPAAGADVFAEFVSDPAHPVPYVPGIALGMTKEHMVEDQRFAATRPDVLVFRGPVLEDDLTLAGPLTARLQVSTTGTDADWVVKLIDVYPGDHPDPEPNPAGVRLGGYQHLVRGEAMRGKFRNSYEKPEPFVPGQVTEVSWTLPDVCHTFRRGHRVMVQVQSSWFPLVDLNPQTFCDIYRAGPADFRKATHRVVLGGARPSVLQVRVLPSHP